MDSLINKLDLGTVQFGLDYGVNNFNGKPAREKSLAMLDLAYDKGIKIFDTAYAYGDAEEILGEFLQRRKLKDEVKIITKLKPNIVSEDFGSAADVFMANLEESLKRLKRDFIDGYLFHTPAYIREKKLVAIMGELKKQGLVKNIGVSIYEEDDALFAVNLPEVDFIQVPYSILDQRMDKVGFFEKAQKNNKTVFARSAFLQGLFFMAEEKIPIHLEKVKEYFRELDKIISGYGLNRQQVALLFSLRHEGINYTVFGVDNLEQLKDDLEIAENNIDCQGCLAELKGKFIDIEKSIIFPSLWKK